MVGANAAKRDSLSTNFDRSDEGLFSKMTAVAMVMFDCDIVCDGELFECLLGPNCLLRRQRLVKMDVGSVRVVVYKDCSTYMSASCEGTLSLRNESGCWGL